MTGAGFGGCGIAVAKDKVEDFSQLWKNLQSVGYAPAFYTADFKAPSVLARKQ